MKKVSLRKLNNFGLEAFQNLRQLIQLEHLAEPSKPVDFVELHQLDDDG